MERRDILGALGVLTLAGLTASAQAADHSHHHDHHHGSPGKLGPLANSAADCVVKGDACLAHCLVLLADGDKPMAECAKSVNQMLAFCGAMQKLAAQQAPYAAKLAKLAIDVWADCEKECRKHEKKHAECKACADACADCIKQAKALGA
jgi:Cys-rich four helix bundle protein (predicted Tat secretion target)